MSTSVIVVGLENVLRGLDPASNRLDQPGMVAAGSIMEPLFAFDEFGVPRPFLAERCRTSRNFCNWTITLRDGIRFHDGVLLRAHHVVDALNAVRESPLTGMAFASVVDVQGDGLEVRVALAEPWASFTAALTGQLGLISRPGRSPGTLPIGTGPFRLDSLDSSGLLAEAYQSHWFRPAKFDQLEMRVVVDQAQRADLLLKGSLDVIHATDTGVLDRLDKAPTVSVIRSSRFCDTGCIMINTAQSTLSDVRVRRALGHATDRRAIIEEVFDGVGEPVDSPLDDQLFDVADVGFPTFDPVRARELLDEAGVEELEIQMATLLRDRNIQFAELVSGQWKKVGVHLSYRQMDQQDLITEALMGEFDVAEWHQFGSVDPDENAMFWHGVSSQPTGNLSLNMTRVRDDALTIALDEGRRTRDPRRRMVCYRQVAERLASQMPYIWILRTPYGFCSRAAIKGVGQLTLPDGQQGIGLIGGRFSVSQLEIA